MLKTAFALLYTFFLLIFSHYLRSLLPCMLVETMEKKKSKRVGDFN